MLELTAAAEKSLAWIEGQRDEFSLRRGRDPWEQAMLLKPFSELMLTVTLLSRDAPLRTRLAPIVDWAWGEINNGSLLIDLSSAKAELVECVGLYADFAACGKRNAHLEAWLSYLVNTDVAQGLELTPWRAIAYAYNLQRLALGAVPALPVTSWLGALPEPWAISVSMAYPLTHDVFYLTDFGRHPEGLDPQLCDYVALWLPVWQQCFQEPENLDLLAEFVMTAACLHIAPDEAIVEQLADRQFDDGSVAGPRGAGQNLPAPKGDTSRRRFLSNYHTTLVSALALTCTHWNPALRSTTTAHT